MSPISYSNQVAIKETFGQRKVSFIANDIDFQTRNNSRMKNRIREIREQKNMTQEQLAERIGKVKSAISKLENGRAELTLSIMESIARVFQCHPSDLIDDPIVPKRPIEQELLLKFRTLREPEKRIIYKIMDMEETTTPSGNKR